jgi:hypothetical protein
MPFSDHATLTYTLIGLFSVSALAFLLSQPTDFAKWVQKKKYQYEVTFSLYMLTPTEKFVFSTSPPILLSFKNCQSNFYTQTPSSSSSSPCSA